MKIYLTDSGRNVHRRGEVFKFYSRYVKSHLLTSSSHSDWSYPESSTQETGLNIVGNIY